MSKTAPFADLHMHTHYSDGRPSPRELVAEAAARGLKTIAITDHFTFRGSIEARPIAEELGLRLIPAMETTAKWESAGWPLIGYSTDVLAYFIDFEHPAAIELEEKMLGDYHRRTKNALAEMEADGHPVTFEECIAYEPGHYASIFEVMAVLVTKGYDADAVFDLVIGYFQRHNDTQLGIAWTIDKIHEAGGVAVLAHPAILRVRGTDDEITSRHISELVDMGLDGIEIYHYRLATRGAREYYQKISKPFRLVVTGGSDEHGRPFGYPRLAQEPITREMVEELETRKRTPVY